MTIEQIVSTAGGGKLHDQSECSTELRTFLSQVDSEKLAEYADHCLTNKFNQSGCVLQDIVNEIGRRLDYDVSNGRYHGTRTVVGNDGLWLSPEGHYLLVEVKTTDTFRVSLNTIADYRDRLREKGVITTTNSMLLVVGRQDTGELEAQVRGSRHAWDMRLISVESLVHLVKLKESTEEALTGTKIRSILIPMEYTRLDALIDVMFTAAKDVETTIDTEKPPIEDSEKSSWEFTDPAIIQAKRLHIVDTFAKQNNVKLIRRSRALYWNADHTFRLVCTVSKRYQLGATRYWYAYHPQWDDFLRSATESFLVLGCVDRDTAFAIPVSVIRQRRDELNTTPKGEKSYWHIKIIEERPDEYALQIPKTGNHLPLNEYAFRVRQES